MKRLALLPLLLVLALAACAGHSLVPDEDRLALERTLPGRTFYLRGAMYLGPFWSDRHKQLLSDVVPGEIPYLASPTGGDIDPGTPTSVVPAGTRVRVRALEMPTGFVVSTRTPVSPRYNPWLLLEIDGRPEGPTPALVLRADLRSREEVMQEIDRHLSSDDLRPVLASIPETVLRAVNEKRLVDGMSAEAVRMAWGWPERRTITPSQQGRREEWVWPQDRRRATIVDGRLISWTGTVPQLASGAAETK